MGDKGVGEEGKVDTEVTPTKEELQTANLIERKRGNISAVAKSLKLARKTVYKHIKNSEYLQDVLADAREKTLDDAEDRLGDAVRKGEAWAVCFTLKTQGQSRGYVEKQRIEHEGEIKTNTTIVIQGVAGNDSPNPDTSSS